MRAFPLLLVVALFAGPALAQRDQAHRTAAAERPAAREWTHWPLLVPVMSRRGARDAAAVRPVGIETATVTVFAADGPDDRRRVDYSVGPEGARFESAAPRVGNYHWLVARQESPAEVRVASTAWFFSNPGTAPTTLLRQPKQELEIVPELLPREHGVYREAEAWRFLVRWKGAPLPNQKVTLETEFGSRSSYISNAGGVVMVLFPRDFRDQPGRAGNAMGRRRAKFVLGTEYDADGRRYLTAFNYTYSPDPARERSPGWGAAFGALGMVAALPLLRRRSVSNHSAESKNA